MADQPSRALVLYGDGLARFIQPSHIHLHYLASRACCGFLSLPNAPLPGSEDERVALEFAQLLDSCEAYLDMNNEQADKEEGHNSSSPTISDRFMGMKAAIVTNNQSLKSFCGKLGFTVLQFDGLVSNYNAVTQPPVEILASQLLALLGFEEGKTLEPNEFDLLFIHIGAGEKMDSDKKGADAGDIEYINALVGAIMQEAQPGSEIGSRLHLSVVMSYGYVSEANDRSLSFLTTDNANHPHLSVLFPRQSYNMRGESLRKDVRHHSPMLLAQWQYAVTRKDLAETFSFKDFKEYGGNLVIPADRFLHEVAFKLWKAPKYGA